MHGPCDSNRVKSAPSMTRSWYTPAFSAVLLFCFCTYILWILMSYQDTAKLEGIESIPTTHTAEIIVVPRKGRLGNMMNQYALLWSLARKFDLPGPALFPDMRKKMVEVFPGLSINQTRSTSQNLKSIDIQTFLLHPNSFIREARTRGIFLQAHTMDIDFFQSYRSEILKEFRFRPDLSNTSQSILHGLRRNGTYIGVHIRRKDYARQIGSKPCHGRLIDERYFKKAMDFMRKLLFGEDLTFVVTSDDKEWAEENVVKPNSNDTFWVGNSDRKRREEDMATLASCNHSIISLGTFGFWAAYLAGGLTVLPDKFCNVTYFISERVKMANVPGWVFLDVNA